MTALVNCVDCENLICVTWTQSMHSHKIHHIYYPNFEAYSEVSGVFLILTSLPLLLLLVAFLRADDED